MSVHIPAPEILEFTEINIGAYKTTKHFDLVKSNTNTPPTQKAHIVRDRQFARSLPDYWLSYRYGQRWIRITGLFKVGDTDYFKGDIGVDNVKKHLIIFKFHGNSRDITVYTFKDYYSKDLEPVIDYITKNNL